MSNTSVTQERPRVRVRAAMPDPARDDGFSYATVDFQIGGGETISVGYYPIGDDRRPSISIRIANGFCLHLTREQWDVIAAAVNEAVSA